MTTFLLIESAPRRAFASALDWPGWCRAGRTEQDAIAALAAYAGRYAPVCARAGVAFPLEAAQHFEVIERVAGNATTEFGAPAIEAVCERQSLDANTATRLAAVVAACWDVFDSIVAAAPAQLKKGPRGGGRDRDPIALHVAKAELAYARKLGIRLGSDRAAVRTALLQVLGVPWGERQQAENGLSPRYAARRIAWHTLDHAWEIEDKS
ncbi:MAG: hypothetical protein ABSG36_01735 [Acidimicrobiales bacterium]